MSENSGTSRIIFPIRSDTGQEKTDSRNRLIYKDGLIYRYRTEQAISKQSERRSGQYAFEHLTRLPIKNGHHIK